MATWQTITVTALKDAKAAQLIAAVQTTCLASGQADPTTNLIANIVEEVRGAIGFSGKYQVSATAASVPPNLVDMAVQKIVRNCKRRLEQPLTQDERDEEQEYKQRVSLLRQGQWPIETPDDPLATQISAPQGRVSEVVITGNGYSRTDTRYL